jgi:hypothetical protein
VASGRPPILTVEEAIEEADRLPMLISPAELLRLSLVEQMDAERHALDRDDLRRAVQAGQVASRYVDDNLCDQSWTVLAYVTHSGTVQHLAGDVVPAPVDVDERGLGRAGESKTAAHR